MKKITLLFLFLSTVVATAQSKRDFTDRTEALVYHLKSVAKKNPDLSMDKVFAKQKLIVVDSIVKPNPEQRIQIANLFESQYSDWDNAYTKYKNGKTAQSKIDLYKVFVKNEEDYRRLLSEDQKLNYTAYHNSVGKYVYFEFKQNFMSDEELLAYKKQLL